MTIGTLLREAPRRATTAQASTWVPQTEEEAADMVRSLAAGKATIRIQGGGTRQTATTATEAVVLETRLLAGITRHAPEDFLLTARAGTPLAEVQEALAHAGQRLAFEPPDHRTFLGTRGTPTLGGMLACNLAGPRRPFAGDAREHLAGLRCVNGRGEIVQSGGHSLKNVAGLDLGKLVAGSWGSLALVTELSLRVEAVPACESTWAFAGTAAEAPMLFAGIRACGIRCSAGTLLCPRTTRALGIVPPAAAQGLVLVRLEGSAAAVRTHGRRLRALHGVGDALELQGGQSRSLWAAVRDLHAFRGRGASDAWCIPLQAGMHPAQDALQRAHQFQLDWCGARAWLAGAGNRPALQPAATSRLRGLLQAVKHAFDPAGVFDPDSLERAQARQEPE